MATIEVNDTTLYYERYGQGPPVLFITGATGDAGHFSGIADALSSDYTVVTFDRRGNSRSPRPAGWTEAPVQEQADDVAALLGALDLSPAVVYGTSAGALYLTNLALRRPELLRGTIYHDPPYLAVTSQPESVGAGREALIAEGMAKGGPPAAVESFLRFACGDEVFESFDPDLRARCAANGEVLFGLELTPVMNYLPDSAELAQVRVPGVVITGAEHRDPAAIRHWFYEASQWLATQLGVPLVETPGGHAPQASHPEELLATLRPILHQFSRS